MLIKNFKIFFKYLFYAKWVFKLPKKNKFLVFDGNYVPFYKYINKNNITILNRRFEEINFFILLKCLINFKFSTLEYCKEFIKQVSPRLILTAFDYHSIFYKLSLHTGIDTLMLQKGNRSKAHGIISEPKKYILSKKNENFINYILLYNNKVKNFYKKKINGKYFIIGSFENNFEKLNKLQQKKDIVFISNYSFQNKNKSENEELIAYKLYELAKKNNLSFNILPRYRNDKIILNSEIAFYKKKFTKNLNFIFDKNKTSYQILINYKYVFATYSTLAAEFLSKGGRAGFLMFKSKQNEVFHYRFGGYEGLAKSGPFWTSENVINDKEIKRVFKYAIMTKESLWKKGVNLFGRKVIDYDFDNKVFQKIIKKYL